MNRVFLFLGIIVITAPKADAGKDLFQVKCAACHTIGQGRLVGPDLYDVSSRRDPAWLVDFIRSSQTMINSGDPIAVAVYGEFNKILMPDAGLSDAEIQSVLNYIDATSQGGGQAMESGPVPDLLEGTTALNIKAGARLFSGADRLSAGGQACSHCHQVKDNGTFSSGSLAKELTLSYESLGSAGISSILKSPPFPAMKDAYATHALTEEEILNLTAYLKSVSQNRFYQNARDYTLLFILLGGFGFMMIIFGIYMLYFTRKRESVNHLIFKRQSPVVHS